jgi:hypothetical protein
MSIAILPMSSEFGWSPATVGLIQSSFFWGYLLTQVYFRTQGVRVCCGRIRTCAFSSIVYDISL